MSLQDVFLSFASFGSSSVQREMDSAKFSKLCKDAGIVDKRVTKTDVDLIFTRAKGKERKINFVQFGSALQMLADKKGCSVDQMAQMVMAAGGPSINGTVADAVRFHDDKSSYTGVYGKGGPTNIDRNNVSLNFLLDRSPADVRGSKPASLMATEPTGLNPSLSSLRIDPDVSGSDDVDKPPPSPVNSGAARPPSALLAPPSSRPPSAQQMVGQAPVSAASGNGVLPPVRRPSSSASQAQAQALGRSNSLGQSGQGQDGPHPPSSTAPHQPSAPSSTQTRVPSARSFVAPPQADVAPAISARVMEEAVAETFRRFCTLSAGGEAEIDSFKFSKMLKDTELLDSKKLTKTAADLIFTKAKAKGAKKMTFHEFRMVAVPLMAQTKGVDEATIYSIMAQCDGPRLNGTVPDAVRFHDDKSTYTGVYGKGGPTNVDGSITLSNLADRTDADVRGVKGGMASSGSSSQFASARPVASGAGGGPDIYDRLNDKSSYTGVYAKRFEGGEMGGRINDDVVNVSGVNRYTGSTTTAKTDGVVRDLSDILSRR